MAKTIVIDTEVRGVGQAVTDINKIDNAVDDVNKKSISPKFDSAKTEKSLENLQKKAEQIDKIGQGIAAGFALATGVVDSFGAELGFSSEEMEKAQAKASSFVSILTSIKPVIEGVKAGFELITNSTKIATVAQWLYNAAMALNPIGLIVAGVVAFGAAIAVGITYVGEITNSLKGLGVAGRIALAVLTLGMSELFIAVGSATSGYKELSAAENKRAKIAAQELSLILKNISELKNKIKLLNEEIKIADKAKAATIAKYDQEIRLLQASGKETYAKEKEKLAYVIAANEKTIQQKLKVHLFIKNLQELEAKANKKLYGENWASIIADADDTEQVRKSVV